MHKIIDNDVPFKIFSLFRVEYIQFSPPNDAHHKRLARAYDCDKAY